MVLLMGTCDEVPKEPVDKPKFIEDMNESELAQAVSILNCHPTIPEKNEDDLVPL